MVKGLGWKCTLHFHGMRTCTFFLLSILMCFYQKMATTRELSLQLAAFLFVVESCKHYLEPFWVSLGLVEGSTGD